MFNDARIDINIVSTIRIGNDFKGGGSMKKIRNIFILILCSLLLFSCNKKEEEKVAAPVMAMSEIDDVSEEKIKVSVY